MTQSIVDQIRSLFKHIAREPLFGERKLGVLVGISNSTAGKYKKKAKELGLLPEGHQILLKFSCVLFCHFVSL